MDTLKFLAVVALLTILTVPIRMWFQKFGGWR